MRMDPLVGIEACEKPGTFFIYCCFAFESLLAGWPDVLASCSQFVSVDQLN